MPTQGVGMYNSPYRQLRAEGSTTPPGVYN